MKKLTKIGILAFLQTRQATSLPSSCSSPSSRYNGHAAPFPSDEETSKY